jgi:hypothetical protein
VARLFYDGPSPAATDVSANKGCQRQGMQHKVYPVQTERREGSSWGAPCLESPSWQLRTVIILDKCVDEDAKQNLRSDSL